MKKLFVFCLLLFYFFFIPSIASAQNSPEPIPGEIIVSYKDGNSPDDLAIEVERRRDNSRRPVVGFFQNALENIRYRVRREDTPERKLEIIDSIHKNFQVKSSEQSEVLSPLGEIYEVSLPDSTQTETLLRKYQSLSTVDYASLNYRGEAARVPTDTYYSSMWGLSAIGLERGWDVTTGSGVKVAVIDSGIDYSHSELGGSTGNFNSRVVGGWDFADNDPDPMDFNGHGTHVAGTIGAISDNSSGVTGVVWNVELLAVKVLDSFGYGSFIDFAQGVVWAADHGAKVINMSLQGWGDCSTDMPYLQEAVDYARSRGVVLVVAAGNYSTDATYMSPASCNGVVTVGALSSTLARATYSNYGELIDIAAPGGDSQLSSCSISNCIYSTFPGNLYTAFQGTSMASPHVAGVAALLLARNPNLSPDEVESILRNSGDIITTDFLLGRKLNAFQALSSVVLTPTGTPTPTLSPVFTSTPTSTPTPTVTSTPTPTQTQLWPGDLNGNGRTDIYDYSLLVSHFGTRTPSEGSPADMDRDGDVDIYDYNNFVYYFVNRPRL